MQPEGVTPTTDQIYLLRYGEASQRMPGDNGVWIQTAPVDLLSKLTIVDTPGTNAIVREHETLTSEFIPRSDLVLFVTSAERPFTESESLSLTRDEVEYRSEMMTTTDPTTDRATAEAER